MYHSNHNQAWENLFPPNKQLLIVMQKLLTEEQFTRLEAEVFRADQAIEKIAQRREDKHRRLY